MEYKRGDSFLFNFETNTGWVKSHFTLLKANKRKPNITKYIDYISNGNGKLEVSLGIYYFISTRWSTTTHSKRNHSKVSWPPQSPDLTPPDIFLWGYLK